MKHLHQLILLLVVLLVSCKQEVYFNVTTNVQPAEGGSIVMNPSSGQVLEGTAVTFTAQPKGDYVFAGWSGSLSGTENPKTITATSDMAVTANFTLRNYPLTLTVEGEGSITEKVLSSKADYASGTVVELTAVPATGWSFDHWEGDLNGNTNPTQITVSSAKSVKAVFVKKMYDLTIVIQGDGEVSEKVIATKSSSYQEGTLVELTAQADKYWMFDHWEGDLSGLDNPVVITIDSPSSVKAVFIQHVDSPNPPHFSEAIELICLVFRLAEAEEYNTCRVPSVYESADSYFASMKNHAAVSLARQYRQRGISYGAVTSYGLHLVISDQGVISFNPDYIGNLSPWNSQQKKDMLAALNNFYKESNFHEWYLSMEPYRQEALRSFEKTGDVDHDWFDSFFGPIDNLSTHITLSFLSGVFSYGCSFDLKNGERVINPVIGMLFQDSSGVITYNGGSGNLVHEFSHPYCDPLIYKYWKSIEKKASSVFVNVEDKMRSQAQVYGNARTMMCETFVRASTVRYLIDHSRDKKQQSRIQNEVNKGFLLVPTFVDILDQREQERDRYATMDDFMPEIIKAVNEYEAPNYTGSGQYDEYTYPSTANLLPGVFSVSPTKKVQFTKGNLYWDGTKWQFEANQMNYPNRWNPEHVGHFYWTTDAADAVAEIFRSSIYITATTSDHLFCDGSDEAHSLSVEGIDGLRVLGDGENGEIGYLLNQRQNASNLYRYPVSIKGVGNCLVIAPDGYSGTIKSSYNAETWASAEAAGLVCLTTAGNRIGATLSDIDGFKGRYWTGTPKIDSVRHAHMLSIIGSLYRYPSYSSRSAGFSIRLVKDVVE